MNIPSNYRPPDWIDDHGPLTLQQWCYLTGSGLVKRMTLEEYMKEFPCPPKDEDGK